MRRYEIDLVAERDGTVAFVEVKTRGPGPQAAFESFHPRQMMRIRRAAEAWIHAHPGRGTEFRFDLVAVQIDGVELPVIDHFEDAFHGDAVR